VDENGGSAVIAVRRTGSTNGTVTVNYLTRDGTAAAGSDYVAQAGALSFGPGQTNNSFKVPILPDRRADGNQTVNLALGNPVGGVILGNQQTATLTIIDNTNSLPNSPPVLTVPPDQTISELSTLTVTNSASDADVPADTLTFSLLSGPPGAHLDSATGLLTWTPTEAQGPSTNLITVRVTANGIPALNDT